MYWYVKSLDDNLGTSPEVQGNKATTCSCSQLLSCQEQGREPLEVCFHDSEGIFQWKAESMSLKCCSRVGITATTGKEQVRIH